MTTRQIPLVRRMLDVSLGAWGALVVFRFFAPILGLERAALSIEKSAAHVALLGLCLALAAANGILGERRAAQGNPQQCQNP